MVALAAEAKPLISLFGLQPERNQHYRSYTNGTVSLVETGIGRLNAAAATASALERNAQAGQKPLCVNIGIAGANRPVGELLAADRIVDEATGQTWHPQLTAMHLKTTACITTVSSPSTDYQADTAFDMEASGFLAAATRFSSLEFIHSLKVISDNPETSLAVLDKNRVSELIAAKAPEIKQTIDELSMLQQKIPEHSDIIRLILECKHFMKISATQETTLFRLLQRHRVIERTLPSLQQLEKHNNIKTLLATLSNALDKQSRHY